MSPKWRPALWMVLGGALAGTLVLSLAGLVALRYLGPAIGFRSAALLLAVLIGLATLVVGVLLVRLLLRPVTALAGRAAELRSGTGGSTAPLAHYGTRELRGLGQSVLDMARTLQRREATIRSFTDHATHELKTPVSAIRAAAELLEESDSLVPDDRRLVAQIQGAAVQMQGQLGALRRIAAAREPAHHGASRLDDLAGALAAGHPGLELEISGGALSLPLDAGGLRIVLSQLLENSARHGACRVRLTARREGRGAVLEVADDGSGISEGNRARIFEPFFTTRREDGGTGMGLTIAANLLSAHGGAIRLAPTDRGTVFEIEFSGA